MKYQKGFTAIELLIAAVVVLGAGGWVANIVKMVGSDFDPITGLLIARVVGIFLAPLGAVLGYV